MINPMMSSFIRGSGHVCQGAVEALDNTHRFVVFGGSRTQVDAAGIIDGLAEAAGQVAAVITFLGARIRDNLPRGTVARDYMSHKCIKDLL